MIANRQRTVLLVLALACVGCLDRDHSGSVVRAEAPRVPSGRTLGVLKVASWNLEWLNRQNGTGPVKRTEADYARLRAYADRLAADVIALQEVDGVEAAARVFDPTRYRLHVAARGDTQRTGFAVRRELTMEVHPDYDALDVGQLRAGADITVRGSAITLRLLSVHLKSGCFDAPLTGAQRECQKLAAQLPALEQWIDARGRERVPAVVLGDFNRRLFGRKDDAFWRAIDDADPPDSDLWSPTDGQISSCWAGDYPAFIDHIVLNLPAKRASIVDSFEPFGYDAADARFRRVLSDHCPIALSFDDAPPGVVRAPLPPRAPAAKPLEVPPPAPPPERLSTPIKGNVNGRGKRLYHAPNCPDYPRVEIDEGKGERWFRNAAEAEAAGFTKAGNCRD